MPPAPLTGFPTTEAEPAPSATGTDGAARAERRRLGVAPTLVISVALNAGLGLLAQIPCVYTTMLLMDLAGELGLARYTFHFDGTGYVFVAVILGLVWLGYLAVAISTNRLLCRHSTMSSDGCLIIALAIQTLLMLPLSLVYILYTYT